MGREKNHKTHKVNMETWAISEKKKSQSGTEWGIEKINKLEPSQLLVCFIATFSPTTRVCALSWAGISKGGERS